MNMFSTSRTTRRSTRRIGRGDRPSDLAKHFTRRTVSTSRFSSTSRGGERSSKLSHSGFQDVQRTRAASTSRFSSKSRGGERGPGPSDSGFQEAQRKTCPVTGLFREISEDYDVSSTVLGRGNFGVVRECEHRATRRSFAVKSLDKWRVRRLDHIRREVYLMQKVNHRGIVKLVDCYEDARYVHIVTERCAGGELFDQISENTASDGCFSERKAASVIKSLLEAVAYLHDNDIVHRDIKPGNILFKSSREGSSIRLIDFGLSRKHKRGERPMDNPVGTAYYMAPELLERNYDRSCDVWSVGIVAYILLCGYPPFNGKTEAEIFGRIRKAEFGFFPATAWAFKSDDALDFISCLLRMDPAMRPTAREALNHPWINANAGDGAKSNDLKKRVDPAVTVQGRRKVVSRVSRFKKLASVVLRREKLS